MNNLTDIANKPHVYSWSTKIDFEINSIGGFKDFDSGSVCLHWDQDLILTLEKRTIHPNLEASGTTGYRFLVDATETACEAEELGKRLACALLKVAIDRQWGVRLSWQDTPLPCRVVDRTASRGVEMQGFMSVQGQLAIADFTDALERAFLLLNKVPYRLLLSMELCASASFETDNRPRLILLVSALEALSEQANISSQITGLIPLLLSVVQNQSIDDSSLKSSILGQIRDIERESCRRAIMRKLREASILASDVKIIEEAYSARSKVVHEGLRVPELSLMNGELDRIIRQVFAYELSLGKE
jgi:hypothetical protein